MKSFSETHNVQLKNRNTPEFRHNIKYQVMSVNLPSSPSSLVTYSLNSGALKKSSILLVETNDCEYWARPRGRKAKGCCMMLNKLIVVNAVAASSVFPTVMYTRNINIGCMIGPASRIKVKPTAMM